VIRSRRRSRPPGEGSGRLTTTATIAVDGAEFVRIPFEKPRYLAYFRFSVWADPAPAGDPSTGSGTLSAGATVAPLLS
jgi:hypothetical protein